MRAVIQRVTEAKVRVAEQVIGQIGQGLVVLLGITHDDSKEDADYLVKKISHLRIFEDDQEKMNLSLLDVKGQLLSISQFTLYSDTRKGRRPNFMEAAKPDQAEPLYDYFNQQMQQLSVTVKTGKFGAMMDIDLINNGPVTIMIDSRDRQ
ncbi:D-aminoacyl-tRNA deacylase [Amphibacillus cookii]|uniref:D-aminoacyl-tRNA deacylase n=1 Tax=Amphibacillus cookii TaxID=767787 RepID=UPI00195BFEEF|nr:D-aminoacyl-tRNA deacylase [Amphibacillus cookii]MBM7541734.1 D-tyrosyl-tRNA(Tyr) deacylase [Amphibacillus cookii]